MGRQCQFSSEAVEVMAELWGFRENEEPAFRHLDPCSLALFEQPPKGYMRAVVCLHDSWQVIGWRLVRTSVRLGITLVICIKA